MTGSDSAGPTVEAFRSFDALFVTEYPKMVALASAVAGSRAHAEDIAQEAMSRMSRDWKRVQTLDKPGAWLRRVTINLALSQKRKFLSEAKALLRIGADVATMPPSLAEHEPIWAAVADLPKQQRAAIALQYLEDRSTEEIADILDISPSTARVHLHRARQTLRDRFEQENIR